ncbi:MAG TPA: MFS transporter [Gemmatimonas aurantiaca]|uniref:Major facilitator superfamily protein n=2 Tax=Gemmatimonas aurantiaca TaxID=173480 RepID=C1A3H9_GEMAT|nr:MFS transporter [Gemmatimonas aurantiaca]BAH37056.1 major facilitator superfamily protein [Gemmatimonas aurantiaca T-27]HCT58913.1 MFS transporter [Gemmatimonas aurantiaca]
MAAAASPAPSSPRGVLNALGLHRPELRAWAMYDWAVSAMQTVIMTAVFPIYFISVAGDGRPPEEATQALANANTIAAILIAVLGPILGAIADYKAAKKPFLAVFMLIGVFSTLGMYFIMHGDLLLASTLFILAMAGATGSMTFYESLLPHIADEREIDRVSTAAYAMGYVGGGVLLAINLAWITNPGLIGLPSGEGLTRAQATLPVRLAFVSVGIWWLLFSIPVFRRVPEPRRALEADEGSTANPFVVAFTRLGETLRELRHYRQAFLTMLAFTIYNDGIQTIIKMATAYGTEIGIERSDLITAILIVQFVGIPFAFAFGTLAGKLGAKLSIMLGLLVYTGICIFAYGISTAREFYILAILVGMVQGGTQALSRSLFASMVPKHKSGEFFGFYSVFEKFGGILGPLMFSIAIGQTGSSRGAILWVIGFFVVGGALLMLVNTKEGEAMAREANARTHSA